MPNTLLANPRKFWPMVNPKDDNDTPYLNERRDDMTDIEAVDACHLSYLANGTY